MDVHHYSMLWWIRFRSTSAVSSLSCPVTLGWMIARSINIRIQPAVLLPVSWTTVLLKVSSIAARWQLRWCQFIIVERRDILVRCKGFVTTYWLDKSSYCSSRDKVSQRWSSSELAYMHRQMPSQLELVMMYHVEDSMMRPNGRPKMRFYSDDPHDDDQDLIAMVIL